MLAGAKTLTAGWPYPGLGGEVTLPVLLVCTLHRQRLLAQSSLRVLQQCRISRGKRSSQPAVGSILQQPTERDLSSCPRASCDPYCKLWCNMHGLEM
jgi:hypothetical protein